MKKGSGKRKGSSFERDIARLLDKYWEAPEHTFWRTPNSGGWYEAGDVYSRDKSIWFPFIVECKAYKTLDLLQLLTREKTTKLYIWWSQLVRERKDAIESGRPLNTCKKLLIIKINNFPVLAVYDIKELPTTKEEIKKFKVAIGNDLLYICLFSDFRKVYPKDYLIKTIRM